MITLKQVELARPGSKRNVDFELVDYSDGNGQQIRRLNPTFDIPTQAELNAVKAQADADELGRQARRGRIRDKTSGANVAALKKDIEDIKATLAELMDA